MGHFSTTTQGKCILAGEHAVLTGHPLVAKSVPGLTLTLSYVPSAKPFSIWTPQRYPTAPDILQSCCGTVIKKALKTLGCPVDAVRGAFYLLTNMPAGAGVGFSAALCLAVCEWLIWQGWLRRDDMFLFARHLEDTFHGTSSGADIAASLQAETVLFKLHRSTATVHHAWRPQLYVAMTHSATSTANAVRTVQAFRTNRPGFAESIDKKMHGAVDTILSALSQEESTGFPTLAEGLSLAKDCFRAWRLLPPALDQDMAYLEQQGAVATKPTGSGGGGAILALWKSPPPQCLRHRLLPLYEHTGFINKPL